MPRKKPTSDTKQETKETARGVEKDECARRPDSLHNLGCVGLVLTIRDISDLCPDITGKRLWVKRVVQNYPAAQYSEIKVGLEVTRVCSSDTRARILQGDTLSSIAADFLGNPGTACPISFYDHAEERGFVVALTIL